MKLPLRQFDQPIGGHGSASRDLRPRGAFTLTELLVAMGIFVILATLTVGAFRANNQDRVGNAAANFKNALEGARSRAINSGEIRGLRLLLDPNDNHIVTSVVYVGSPGFVTGTVPTIRDYGDFDGDGDGSVSGDPATTGDLDQDSDGSHDPTRWGFSRSVFADSYYERGLIRVGSRVEIPANSNRWYSITKIEEPSLPGQDWHNDRNGADDVIDNTSDLDVFLAGHFQPSSWAGRRNVCRFTGPVDVRVELAPTILEGAEPLILDSQVCIDLDGSIVPNTAGSNRWRNSSGGYNTPMEILFNPNGTITGDLETEGVVHFLLSYTSDVILAQALAGRPTSDENPVIPKDPVKDRKAVSIFTATGGVVVSNVNAVDSDGVPFNESPVGQGTAFKFAISGREAK